MNRVRVLIADDHPLFLEGLKTVLSLEDDGIDIVGTASNGKEAIEQARALSPDLILMDIRMPTVDGIRAAGEIMQRDRDVKIIMLTTFDDYDLVASAIRVPCERAPLYRRRVSIQGDKQGAADKGRGCEQNSVRVLRQCDYGQDRYRLGMGRLSEEPGSRRTAGDSGRVSGGVRGDEVARQNRFSVPHDGPSSLARSTGRSPSRRPT